MKKFLLLITLSLCTYAGHSQILITLLLGDKLNSDGLEFGLEGGINSSTISGLQTNTYFNNWNLGFYFDIRVKKQWFIYTGVLVKSSLGVRNLTDQDLNKIQATTYAPIKGTDLEGSYEQQLDYFIVPILAKYKFKNNFYAEFGPQLSLAHKGYVIFKTVDDDIETFTRENNLDNINRVDAGLAIGAGYTLFKGKGWTFGAKYYYGLVDVYKNVSGTNNSCFFMKMNIPIGAVKKDDEPDKSAG